MGKIWGAIADYIRECDKIMLLLCLFAGGYGCIGVLTSTNYLGSHRQFYVQLIALVIGFGVAVGVSLIDYEDLLRRWYLLAALGVIPVILTFIIGYAPEGTDDKAWLLLPGGMTFQPAELLKSCFIITFAKHLSSVRDVNKPKNLLLLCAHGAIPVLLIHFQGDDGTALVFGVMFIAMMFAAGVRLRYFIAALIGVLVATPFVFFFIMNEDQKARILYLFDLESNLQGIGYQQWRGRIALANGGFFGQGLFRGELTQSGNVPFGYNDFIFASIGEELGFLGCLAIITVLAAICVRCVRVAKMCQNSAGKIICTGVFAMVMAQSAINIGMCVSVLPVIGITLPFFSAGGTSLMCLFISVGLAVSVYIRRNSRTIYLHD